MNIGDLFLQLLADGSKLTPSVVKEAEKAGDAGAKTLGQRMSVGLRTAGIKAFGVAASGAFAIATKGALELENAQAEIQAQTGLNAEQAKEVAADANRIAGEQVSSLEAVRDIAIAVHNDLGLIGDDADKMTAKIAEFARVTHQDGAAAVTALDEVTDSWNLTAEQQATVLDRLLVSQHKFGGDIQENLKTLAALAPAMRAANMEYGDGIELLNLFGAKGLDANVASAAFAKSLTKVKSPEELQKAIDDIANTKDAFDRASKAADLFGARAGAKLANALGGVDLDDYAVSAEEAGNETKRMADVLDSTFSGRIQKAVSIATSKLREFGASVGPALTGLATVGTFAATAFPGLGAKLGEKLAGGIGTGLAKSKAIGAGLQFAVSTAIEGIPGGSAVKSAVLGGMTKLGTFMGTTAGAAFTVAFAAAAVLAVKFVADQQQAQIDAQGDALLAQAQDFAKKASDTDLAGSIQGVTEDLDKLPLNAYDSRNKVIAVLNTLIAEQNRRGAESTTAFAEGIATAQPEVDMALTSSIVDPTLKAAYAANAIAKKAGEQTPASFAAAVRSRREVVQDAWTQALDDMKNILGRGEVIARDIGILTGKKMQEGLHDRRASVRAEFAGVRDQSEQELALLISRGGKIGEKTMEKMQKGIHSKNKNVRDAWKRVKAIVEEEGHKIPPVAQTAGEKAGQAFLDGLAPKLNRALEIIAATLGSAFRSLGAPGTVAPAGGGGGGGKKKRGGATGGPVRANEPRLFGERGPELFLPSGGGYIYSRADTLKAIAGAGGGSGTTIVNMPVSGALPVRTISDISGEMQRIDDSGLLPENRIAPRYRRRETAGAGARL